MTPAEEAVRVFLGGLALLAVGAVLGNTVLTWWRRRRWTRFLKIEIERNGMILERVHWRGDLPAAMEVTIKEGLHDKHD